MTSNKEYGDQLLEMYNNAPDGAEISLVIKFKKKTIEKTIIKKAEQKGKSVAISDVDECQLDWKQPLTSSILPNKDYLTFDEVELETRKTMYWTEKKKATETGETTNQTERESEKSELFSKRSAPSSSDSTPKTTASVTESSIYEMYNPVNSTNAKPAGINSEAFLDSDATRNLSLASEPRVASGSGVISEDLRLCNSEGLIATSFDLDSISAKTSDIFQ